MARKINLDININIEDNMWENHTPDESFYEDFESITNMVLDVIRENLD